MKNLRFTILIIGVLLSLLGVLAYLQYAWLGQISDGERERLQRNLQTDTVRFADDFNREMQNAFFNFQIDAKDWREKNWNDFNERYKFWREKATYPELLKDFYFVEIESGAVFRFNKETRVFEAAQWTENLNKLKPKLTVEMPNPIAEEIPALLKPVREMTERIEEVLVRTSQTENIVGQKTQVPKMIGVMIIELDETIIKNQILPDLAKKYFSQSDSANYKLAVVNKENQTIYQTENLTATDANAGLFEFSPDSVMFYTNREMVNSIQGKQNKTMVFSKLETQNSESTLTTDSNSHFEMQIRTNEKPRVRVIEGKLLDANSVWTLNVQHTAGSLEQFITNTRRKNLGISFGILSLLGASIVFVFLSAQRARVFAQRQIEFVSSVSHEFRTPLAVIYSAGENLADGVAKEETQVSRYGDLIKGEGKKLSKMVEQILDFAGANSGKKKYDLRSVGVREIIENALTECESLLEDFEVEIAIEENLPPIVGDKNALGQAIQNLIANAKKYSNGKKYIKISAQNGGGQIKITVEDKGIGISKPDLKHIFEPFFRAKSVVDEQIHGNGLGLSLVKETIEAHGGKISAESEIGVGSKFIIDLPF